MNSVILTFVVGYLVDQIANAGAKLNVATLQTGFATWLETASPWLKAHPTFLAMVDNTANPVIAAAVTACQDEPDLKAAIVALAEQNSAAAEGAILALVKGAAPQLAAMLGDVPSTAAA